MNEIMSKQHPQWHEFTNLFLESYTCPDLGSEEPLDQTYQATRSVLEKFPDVDIEKTLDYFKKNYGTKDFEVYVTIFVENEEEGSLEADLWFAIENIFFYYEGKKLSSAEVKNMVLSKGAEFADELCMRQAEGE